MRRYGSILFVAAIGLTLSSAAFAALGQPSDSIATDTQRMAATRHVAVQARYQVHELDLASGTVVREFVTPDGTVFGIAWQGPFQPNIRQLLGPYFERFSSAGQKPHADHRFLRLADQDVVIESAGRMRAFKGRGYVIGLIPAGVSANEIR